LVPLPNAQAPGIIDGMIETDKRIWLSLRAEHADPGVSEIPEVDSSNKDDGMRQDGSEAK
jgi:hypothetical protein